MVHPEAEAERLPILNAERRSTLAAETRVYSRRWYVLVVFCLLCFDQAMVWNTWGPITESAEALFGWNDGDIGMLNNYGNIAFIICVIPFCWFMDVKGMRTAVLISTTIMLLGTGLRCISMDRNIATWMANACAVLNGIAGCVPFAGPPLLSSVWYPPDQRATATAGLSFANYFGVAMSFIIGPVLVRSPVNTTQDHHYNGSGEMLLVSMETFGSSQHKNITNLQELKTDIQHLMYLHGGLCALVFVLTLIYFPSKPPKPPSITASIGRTDYLKGLGHLLSNPSVWLTVLAYAIPTGVLGVWAGVLDVNLKPIGVNQTTAGYLGFWQTLAGCTAGLVISRLSDIFMRRMKTFLIVMFIGAVLSCVWFTILCEKYIPFNTISLYTSCILIGVFVNGTVPLFYEITCEASYPVAEGVTGGFLTLMNNLVGICFLFVLLIKSIGTSWMNWVLLGSTVLALPLLFLFPERYRRTDLDITIDVPEYSDEYDDQKIHDTKVINEQNALNV